MELQDLIEQYKAKFRTDPLYRKIEEIGCLDQLFIDESYFAKVNLSDTYSSKHTAEILSLSGREQTLVNYINREDLSDYLKVYRQGRFYRYDWVNIFRFKMILLLNENGYTPMEIATFAGNRVEIIQNEGRKKTEEDFSQEENVWKMPNIEGLIEEYTDSKLYSLHNLIRYKELQHQEELLHSSIEQFENNIRMLERDMNDREVYSKLFQMTATARNNQQPGFFAKLFSRSANPDNTKTTEEFDQIMTALESNTKNVQDDINNQKALKDELCSRLNAVRQQLATLKLEKETASLTKSNEERMILHDTETIINNE